MRRFALAALAVLLAGCVAVETNDNGQPDGNERFPVPSSYPEGTMVQSSYVSPAPNNWRIHTLASPERPQATWKVVILTGTPSWSDFWAPTVAALPESREIIVADRPGFAQSEPQTPVRELMQQVEALSPMLEAHEGQRVVLIGQSFGAPIATLMAQRYADKVDALVLVSPYFGDRGPTARRLFGVGRLVQPFLGRDLRNSISEMRAQNAQLPAVWDALRGLQLPIVFIHGDADTFVPLSSAERITSEYHHTLITVPEGDHFLNACCVPQLLGAIEQAIAEAEGHEGVQAPTTTTPAQ